MKKTARKILTINIRDRQAIVFKLNHSVKYKNVDGSISETPYILVSRLDERWSQETLGFACNPNGRVLDFESEEVFSEYNVMSEEEALIKQGYTIIK